MSKISGTVVLLLTHRSTRAIDAMAARLADEGLGPERTRILFDVSSGHSPSPALAPLAWTFDSRRMHEWGYSTIGDQFVPGHVHFALLRFFEEHPQADHYWLVEDDVAYTGSWRRFFAAFETDPADLLTTHLRGRRHEPRWYWWKSLEAPAGVGSGLELIRGLLVVARFSRRSLQAIVDGHRSGWRGHAEVVVPTILRHVGHEIADIGGKGPFTPKHRWGRHYSSYSDVAGSLKAIGSVRFRPARSRPGWRPGRLYHPVKRDTVLPKRSILQSLRETRGAYQRHREWRRSVEGLIE